MNIPFQSNPPDFIDTISCSVCQEKSGAGAKRALFLLHLGVDQQRRALVEGAVLISGGEAAVGGACGVKGAAGFHQHDRLGEEVLLADLQRDQGSEGVEGGGLIVVGCDHLAVGGVAGAQAVALHLIVQPVDGLLSHLADLGQVVNGGQRVGGVDDLMVIGALVRVVFAVIKRELRADEACLDGADRRQSRC